VERDAIDGADLRVFPGEQSGKHPNEAFAPYGFPKDFAEVLDLDHVGKTFGIVPYCSVAGKAKERGFPRPGSI
ncbi:MAG: hypothetical protein K6B65_06250, partial [Bacilli bacterium]|nr:hypothetical protein [Bacilli bacterium]